MLNNIYDEKRFFQYEYEGKERWMGLPIMAELVTREGKKKAVWQFEEGEEGRGYLELFKDDATIEVWFTCIEP